MSTTNDKTGSQLDELSIETATPAEARKMLDLKGAENVKI